MANFGSGSILAIELAGDVLLGAQVSDDQV